MKETISKIYQIAKYTVLENMKRRNFLILFLFIIIIMGSGILFSMLAPDKELRVITDLGTASIELFAFLTAAFVSVKMILQEMENRTVYLILARPVKRWTYITGRFLGITAQTAFYIIFMTSALALLLLIKGWSWDFYIVGISISIFFKVLIVISFSIMFSLISTSSASSFLSIFFLWSLGHFSDDLLVLGEMLTEAGIHIAPLLRIIYYIIPNFSILNYKDFYHVRAPLSANFLFSCGYALGYSLVILLISIILFDSKEL